MMLILLRLWFRLLGRLAPELAVRQAARLFMTPERYPVKAAAAPALMAEAVREIFDCDDGRIAVYHWRTTPDAPRVLVAHGWSDRIENLAPVIRSLRDAGFAVTALDWPAHGASSGRITNGAIWLRAARALSAQAGPWHAVVAHSFGGFCIAAATRRDLPWYGAPLEAERLVLLGPPDRSMDMFDIFCATLDLNDTIRQGMLRMFDGILRPGFAAFSTADALADFTGTALVVHDADDRRVPFVAFERIQATAPQHEFLVTCGLGHRRILEDPAVLATVRRFLADDRGVKKMSGTS